MCLSVCLQIHLIKILLSYLGVCINALTKIENFSINISSNTILVPDSSPISSWNSYNVYVAAYSEALFHFYLFIFFCS